MVHRKLQKDPELNLNNKLVCDFFIKDPNNQLENTIASLASSSRIQPCRCRGLTTWDGTCLHDTSLQTPWRRSIASLLAPWPGGGGTGFLRPADMMAWWSRPTAKRNGWRHTHSQAATGFEHKPGPDLHLVPTSTPPPHDFCSKKGNGTTPEE